jgi:hypothetical protein
VDQVGEQRDRAGEGEDRGLDAGGQPEDGQARCDGLDAGARADDRRVDEPVRVPMLSVVATVRVLVIVCVLVVAQEASLIGSE